MIKTVNVYGKKLYTTELAAEKFGINKRTLGDYYYQLKSARSYSFDFDKHKEENIGFLRQFNKSCLKSNKPKIIH